MAPNEAFRPQASGYPGIRIVRARSARALNRHFHDEFGIGIVRRGAQRSTSGRGLVEAIEGDVITVNPGEVHDGAPISDADRAWDMFYISPEVAHALTADEVEGGGSCCEFNEPVKRDSLLAALTRSLFAIALSGDDSPILFEHRLVELLSCTLVGRSTEARSTRPGIAAAIELIEDDPAAPLSLAELSEKCGLSRFHFVRTFESVTGMTPHRFLVQRRCAKARQLIGQGVPLADVAAAAGFSDQSHLTRSFRRYHGFTPGSYANSTRS